MGFGFRKRKKIAPGLFLNFSKSGLGVSAGRRGASISRSARGRKQVSLGWKGFFWRKRI
jgi:Protein of unknown function (DUF4236)